jgi:chitinase
MKKKTIRIVIHNKILFLPQNLQLGNHQFKRDLAGNLFISTKPEFQILVGWSKKVLVMNEFSV